MKNREKETQVKRTRNPIALRLDRLSMCREPTEDPVHLRAERTPAFRTEGCEERAFNRTSWPNAGQGSRERWVEE